MSSYEEGEKKVWSNTFIVIICAHCQCGHRDDITCNLIHIFILNGSAYNLGLLFRIWCFLRWNSWCISFNLLSRTYFHANLGWFSWALIMNYEQCLMNLRICLEGSESVDQGKKNYSFWKFRSDNFMNLKANLNWPEPEFLKPVTSGFRCTWNFLRFDLITIFGFQINSGQFQAKPGFTCLQLNFSLFHLHENFLQEVFYPLHRATSFFQYLNQITEVVDFYG